MTGRAVAAAILTGSGAVVLGLGIFGFIRDGLTSREVITGVIGLVVAVASAAWLRRQRQQPDDDGWAPMNRTEDPYGCHRGKRGRS